MATIRARIVISEKRVKDLVRTARETVSPWLIMSPSRCIGFFIRNRVLLPLEFEGVERPLLPQFGTVFLSV
jgi:hypothetical protein